MVNRWWLIMSAGLLLMLAGFITALYPMDVTIVPHPSPLRHVEYREYPVGRFLLMNTTLADTLGRHPVVQLPEGSILLVPYWVGGVDPDSGS